MSTSVWQRLHAELEGLVAEGNAINEAADKDGFTDEQRARLDEIIADKKRVEADIARQAALRERIQTAPAEPVADVPKPSPEEAPKPFASMGQFLKAVATSTASRQMDPRLMAIEEWGQRQAITGSGEKLGSEGGFLVQQDMQSLILDRIFASGALANRCRAIEVGPGSNGVKIPLVNETSRATGSRFGGVQTYWIDEGGAPTASQPAFRRVDFELKKLAALTYATDELLSDAVAMESILDAAFVEEIAFAIDDAIFDGTGSGQPRGVLNENALVSIAKETGQAANTVLAENIRGMYSRAWARSIRNAVWFINQDVWPELFNLEEVVGTGGSPMFARPGTGLADAPFGTLMGRPIEVIEHAKTLGTKGDITLLDLSQYALVRKGGVSKAASIHVQFTTDETAFRWIVRLQGGSLWLNSLTPYQGTNTVSPFVALDTRS